MMLLKYWLTCLLAFCVLFLSDLNAGNFGTTAANFLKIAPGARISAMADSGTSLANDANALYWNPSMLAFLKEIDLQTTYLNQLSDIHFSQVSFARPLVSGSFGFSGTTLFTTDMNGRDELDRPTDNFTFYNWAFTGAYAKKFWGSSSAGLSLKMIREAIGGETADGIAVDFGLAHQIRGLGFPNNLTNFGVVIQHMGPDFGAGKSSLLPITARMGISNSAGSGKWNSALDVVVPFRGDTELHFGNEWQIHPNFALRAGYRFFHSDSRDMDWFSLITGGFGFYFVPSSSKQCYNLDYAFSTFGTTGYLHKISFGIKFQ